MLNSHNLFIFSPCLLTAWSQKELPEDSRCQVAGRVLVTTRLVSSLNRPGANVTEVTLHAVRDDPRSARAVADQIRQLVTTPEIVVRTWKAARQADGTSLSDRSAMLSNNSTQCGAMCLSLSETHARIYWWCRPPKIGTANG